MAQYGKPEYWEERYQKVRRGAARKHRLAEAYMRRPRRRRESHASGARELPPPALPRIRGGGRCAPYYGPARPARC